MKSRVVRRMINVLGLRSSGAALQGRISRLGMMQEKSALQIGILLSRIVPGESRILRDYEFSIFSQWGEDGILQYLIRKTDIERDYFVEFGVEDYVESNTRFLLMKDNWSGLILDPGNAHTDFLKRSELMWRQNISSASAFLTADNINQVLADNGASGDIGLLSVDIDGNDYWVLRALDVISPRIIVCEYNSLFGAARAVSVPYVPTFDSGRSHFSHLYFGASLEAFHSLLNGRGYKLVGCESHGANAFFVREDVGSQLPSLSVKDAYVRSQFRSSRDEHGNLNYVTGHGAMRALIASLPLVDVITGEQLAVADLPLEV